MTRAREQIVSLDDTPYYHCMARCVRRAFLFGEDSVTGRSYNHRKAWVVDKLAFLADVFAIDVCAYAVMSNHYHLVLRVDVDECESWSMDQVITRWTSLFAGNALVNRYVSGEAISKAEIMKVSEFAELWRQRLCDISWFMRVLNESIARMANEEDECKGRFWEGRFKSQALLDEAAVLACMVYVDLNPIRAGITDLPEDSDFTSIQERLTEFANRQVGRPKKKQAQGRKTPLLYQFNDGVELKDDERALPFSIEDYLELFDWTGRAIRYDKKGYIPDKIPKIFDRLEMRADKWLKFVPEIEKSFNRAVGSKEALQKIARRLDLSWLHGQRVSGVLYSIN